jgi:hypothetical protein
VEKDLLMKRFTLTAGLLGLLIAATGCKKQLGDNDAVRAGIMQHLTAVGTLNISAMEMDIRSVSIDRDKAHADVEFRPKTGAALGAGMQVGYDLQKRDGSWVVLKTQAAGGMMQHPDPGQNPHKTQDVHSGSLPNFNDIMGPAGVPAQGALPPRQAPVPSQKSNPQQPGGPDAASAREPR